MKYIIGFVVATGLFVGGYVLAEQNLADNETVAKNGFVEIKRFEWYGDVCYNMIGGNYAPAISCVKH